MTMKPETLLSKGVTFTQHVWKRAATASCIAVLQLPQSYRMQRVSSTAVQRPPISRVRATSLTYRASSPMD
eukprot:3271605-Rhodomonas_salina.1